jgi:ribosomal protein L23
MGGPPTTYLPTMLLTLVRRVSAKLPYNHFLFRVNPQHTKAEIREYLEKVYNVKVARITTSISLGAWGRKGRVVVASARTRRLPRRHSRALAPPPAGRAPL